MHAYHLEWYLVGLGVRHVLGGFSEIKNYKHIE